MHLNHQNLMSTQKNKKGWKRYINKEKKLLFEIYFYIQPRSFYQENELISMILEMKKVIFHDYVAKIPCSFVLFSFLFFFLFYKTWLCPRLVDSFPRYNTQTSCFFYFFYFILFYFIFFLTNTSFSFCKTLNCVNEIVVPFSILAAQILGSNGGT